MVKRLRILLIRFSSIGDIVLTTPIIRCLHEQLDADVDFLTKKKFKDLLHNNPKINKIYFPGEDFNQLICRLKENKYDYIVDLQNNIRSFKIRSGLGIKSFTYSKNRFKRFMLLKFGVDAQKNHVVDRYFRSITELKVTNDEKGIDFYTNKAPNFNLKQDYISWVIGGTYESKRLSPKQISEVISKLDFPVCLLGSKTEKSISSEILKLSQSHTIYDFCGETSIEESAFLISKSILVLSNDTGMMHIASAYDIPIISFWGCTKPSLGFYPYKANNKSVELITPLSKKPCSKHGKKCNFKKEGCIKEISPEKIYETINTIIR